MTRLAPVFALILLLLVGASVPSVASQSPYSFSDEFSGSTLDTSQWVALNRGGDSGNWELECYLPSNATVRGGFLSLLSIVDPTGCSSIGTTYQYSSSMVQWSTFNFLYGTISTRARFAGGQGTWPSFWLLGANCQQQNITTANNGGLCQWPNPGSDEIDIVEITGSNQSHVNQQIHSSLGNPGCGASVSDVSQNFHTFDLVWAPGQATWKIDGVTTCVVTQAVPSNPMFLMINTAVGGQAAGTVDPATLPQRTDVDYVHVSTGSPAPTSTPTSTPASTSTPSSTPTQTVVPTATSTVTPGSTPTSTATSTPTNTPLPTNTPAPTSTPTSTSTPTAVPVNLVGDKNLEPNIDNNPAGVAEAYSYVATTSGTATHLSVYIEPASLATRVILGIYANSGTNPGALLAEATISAPVAGAWNTVSIPPVTITSGATYWIAMLSPSGAGTVWYRDVNAGFKSVTATASNLTDLPASWVTGQTWITSTMSAYVSP